MSYRAIRDEYFKGVSRQVSTIQPCDSFDHRILSRRKMLDNGQRYLKGGICDTMVLKHIKSVDSVDFQIVTMGSRRHNKLEGKKKSLKRLKPKMKRRSPDQDGIENYGETVIKRVMREIDTQAELNLSKAGKKYQNLEEIRRAGTDNDQLEIQFQRLQIDKTNRVISSPISPRTAAALEGMTTLMADWSTLSESEFKSHLEREGDEEELSSTLKRTILLELVEKKKKETEGDDQIDEEGSEERANDDVDEEEEKHQSEAKTLPTTEVSSSVTSAEEDIEVVTITGLTGTGTDDDP